MYGLTFRGKIAVAVTIFAYFQWRDEVWVVQRTRFGFQERDIPSPMVVMFPTCVVKFGAAATGLATTFLFLLGGNQGGKRTSGGGRGHGRSSLWRWGWSGQRTEVMTVFDYRARC